MHRHITALLTLLLIATSMTVGQPGDRPRDSRPDGPQAMRESFNKELQLTDAQESQMKKLRIDQQRKQTQVESKIKLARLDIHELFQAEKPDRAAIEKALRAISDLQFQAKTNHLDHWFAVYSILTPEQQKKWKEHFEERGLAMQNHMDRFRERMHERMED